MWERKFFLSHIFLSNRIPLLKGYTGSHAAAPNDLQVALAAYAGDAAFAKEFFTRYIEGHDVPDYASLLAKAGYEYQKARPGKVWLDAQMREQGGGLVIAGPTLTTGPLYQAGLDRGDRILKFDGEAVGKPSDLQAILDKHKPGDVISIEADQRGLVRTVQLTFTEDPTVEIVAYEAINKEITPEMKKLRADWLGSQIAGK